MTHNDKRQIPDITRRLSDTYNSIGSINYLGHDPLPSVAAVIEIATDLKEILFPGFRRIQGLRIDNVQWHVGALIDGVHDKLAEQITRALQYRQHGGLRVADDDLCPERRGHELALEFLNRLPAVRKVLADDVQAAYENDPAATGAAEVIFCYPGIEAITNHRIAHELSRLDVPLIPRILSEWSHRETGIDIHPGATIGPAFFIDHGTGVVIGETCVIGSRVNLYQGVTLGAWAFPRDPDGRLIRNTKRHPTIADGVSIYANATILGGDTLIGENSTIGAGVTLSRSVPANTIVTLERQSLRFREAA